MNAKKAKLLRKVAREATVGRPDRQLLVGKEKSKIVKYGDKEVRVVTQQAVNDQDSTRGQYRMLKRLNP